MRYIVEKDGEAIKAYSYEFSALKFAKKKANEHPESNICVHACDGSHSEIAWSNCPIA